MLFTVPDTSLSFAHFLPCSSADAATSPLVVEVAAVAVVALLLRAGLVLLLVSLPLKLIVAPFAETRQ
jgi:hypothetical protein